MPGLMVRPLHQVPPLQGVDVRRQGMRFAEMTRAQSDIRARLISSNIELILRTRYRDAYQQVLHHIQFRVLRLAEEAPPRAVLKTAEK